MQVNERERECVCERGKIKIRKKMAGGGKKEKIDWHQARREGKKKYRGYPTCARQTTKKERKNIGLKRAEKEKYTCLMHAEKESEISAVMKPARAINNTQHPVS